MSPCRRARPQRAGGPLAAWRFGKRVRTRFSRRNSKRLEWPRRHPRRLWLALEDPRSLESGEEDRAYSTPSLEHVQERECSGTTRDKRKASKIWASHYRQFQVDEKCLHLIKVVSAYCIRYKFLCRRASCPSYKLGD